LVPANITKINKMATASMGVALLAPWLLAFFPDPLRWTAEVIGLPLAWAAVWIFLYGRPLLSRKYLVIPSDIF
jgi:hypothetical protein